MSMHEKMTGKGKVIEKNPIYAPPYNAWESVKDGAPDGKYERVITSNFSADSDDVFMRSMIMKYARNKDGSPSSGGKGKDKDTKEQKFMLTKDQALSAAKEVLATHMGLHGAAQDQYLATYWEKAWGHFDVNRTGKIEVEKGPSLMRFLASDQYMQLGESAGGKGKDYMQTYFPRTWAHYDVNKSGKLGVEVMPQFMRFLASDQTLNLQGGKGQAGDNHFAASGKDNLASSVDRLIELYELRLAMMLS